MSGRTVAIVGCGLVGGSLGLALRRRRPSWTLKALDLPEQLSAIRDAGFADAVGAWCDAPALLSGCELVVLATPVEVALEQLAELAPLLSPGTVVTDVAGTKAAIAARAAAVLPEHVCFVGGHPLAGTERAGIGAADPLLFEGRTYVLCPTPETPAPALLQLLELVEAVGAVPLTVDPVEHDQLLATVSHLPCLVAMALADVGRRMDASHGVLKRAVGPAFLDMTRVAASRFEQWKGVLHTNRGSVVEAIDELVERLLDVRRALEADDLGRLREHFAAGNAGRAAVVPSRRRGRSQRELRRSIDEQDETLLRVLRERLRVAEEIGRVKAASRMPALDPEREARVLTSRREWGRALSLPDTLVDSLFQLIVRHSREVQERGRQGPDPRSPPSEGGRAEATPEAMGGSHHA